MYQMGRIVQGLFCIFPVPNEFTLEAAHSEDRRFSSRRKLNRGFETPAILREESALHVVAIPDVNLGCRARVHV